jgi:hypothetical protein
MRGPTRSAAADAAVFDEQAAPGQVHPILRQRDPMAIVRLPGPGITALVAQRGGISGAASS